MNPFWSQIARELSPCQPASSRIANLVKLNTNESPFGPSPLALEAMRAAAADTMRLYPDPEAMELRAGPRRPSRRDFARTGVRRQWFGRSARACFSSRS
jgi:hypothetical protein